MTPLSEAIRVARRSAPSVPRSTMTRCSGICAFVIIILSLTPRALAQANAAIGVPTDAVPMWIVVRSAELSRLVRSSIYFERVGPERSRRVLDVRYCDAPQLNVARFAVALGSDGRGSVRNCAAHTGEPGAQPALFLTAIDGAAGLVLQIRDCGVLIEERVVGTEILIGLETPAAFHTRPRFYGDMGLIGVTDNPSAFPADLDPPPGSVLASARQWFSRGAGYAASVRCADVARLFGRLITGISIGNQRTSVRVLRAVCPGSSSAGAEPGNADGGGARPARGTLDLEAALPEAHLVMSSRWARTTSADAFARLVHLSFRADTRACPDNQCRLGAIFRAGALSTQLARPQDEGGWLGMSLQVRSEGPTPATVRDRRIMMSYGTVGSSFADGVLQMGLWADVRY
jgi:hypothetical protein